MKPIKLKIAGLNSFTDEQTINFENLTQNGLFGIFGPTGSGKSTIIDAITFALYGEISRYDGTIANKAFINTNSNHMSITFEFVLGKGKNKNLYEIKREYAKRNDGSVKPPSARLVLKTSDKNIKVLADKPTEVTKEIIKIIGLKYNDFTRSVILPQGKFSEFLMLENKARRNMLERLFGLEKYGSELSLKLNAAKNTQKSIVDEIKIKLEIYGNITKEDIKNLKETLYNVSNEIEENKNMLALKTNEYNETLKYIKDKKEYDLSLNKLKELELKKNKIKELEFKLDNYKKAQLVYPYLKKEYLNTKNKLENNEIELKKINEETLNIKKHKENTKSEYDKICNENEKLLPVLIKKQSKAEHALTIKNDTDKIEIEISELIKEYKKRIVNFNFLNKNLEIECKNKNQNDTKLKEVLKEKLENTVDTNYRKQIEIYADKEREYNNNLKKQKEYNTELHEKQNLIKVQSEECKTLNNEIKKIKEDNKKTKKKLDFLLNQNYNSDDILIEQENTLKFEQEYNNKSEMFNKLNLLISKIKSTEENMTNFQKKYDNICFELNDLEKLSTEKQSQMKLLENESFITLIAGELKDGEPCPVCGSKEHPNPAVIKLKAVGDELLNDIDKLKIKINELNDEKSNLNIDIYNYKNNLSTFKNEKTEIDKNINGFDKEKAFKKLNLLKQNLLEKKKKYKKWKDDKKLFENLLKLNNESLNKKLLKFTEIKKSLDKDNEQINNIELKLKKIDEIIYTQKSDINNLKLELNTESFLKEYDKINEKQRIKDIAEKQESNIRKSIEEININIENIKNNILNTEKEIESFNILGQEKKNIITKNKKSIEDICDNKNPEIYISEISNKIKKIKNLENDLKKEFEKSENEYNNIKKKNTELSKENNTYKDLLKEQHKKLIENIDEIKNNIVNKDKQNNIEKIIQEYYENYKYISLNTSKLEECINKYDENIKNCDIVKAKETIKKLENKIEMGINKKADLTLKLSQTEEALINIEKLNSEFNENQHKLDILNDIISVTQGNKFVEFMAKKQLKYITMEASMRLNKMTSGRYCIELDSYEEFSKTNGSKLDGVNFVIRDNYNGGIRRTPKTLSGGEIFMTSLSLALALSSRIQLKNKAPLEIFFLDEGFGTLDNELLDTVMDCLEQLSSEKTCVGIITHVEEMKNRIQSKLLVKPPHNGISGTTISFG